MRTVNRPMTDEERRETILTLSEIFNIPIYQLPCENVTHENVNDLLGRPVIMDK